MLRECIRHEPLAKIILWSEQFYDFFRYVEMSTFDIASDAFATFKVNYAPYLCYFYSFSLCEPRCCVLYSWAKRFKERRKILVKMGKLNIVLPYFSQCKMFKHAYSVPNNNSRKQDLNCHVNTRTLSCQGILNLSLQLFKWLNSFSLHYVCLLSIVDTTSGGIFCSNQKKNNPQKKQLQDYKHNSYQC